ncbi:MAG: methyltransferase domain-containing protein [Nitrospira sp.]|nr:methyltransferase domain-containing protein [Nitrospira sp.]
MDTFAGGTSGIKGALKRAIPAAHHFRLRILATRARTLARFPAYRGDRFECPFCGRRFGAFLPDGLTLPVFRDKDISVGGYTEHVRCPWCYSSDRDRLLLLYLRDRTRIFSEALSVLHVAPEFHLTRALRRNARLRYVTGDFSAPSVSVRLNILALPFRPAIFDAIIANHVLEHVVDDRTAMTELFRVLRPGGWAIFQVPVGLALDRTFEDPSVTLPVERERVFGQFDHVRIYGPDYVDRLREAGFQAEAVPYARQLDPAVAARFRLNLREDVFLCKKPA